MNILVEDHLTYADITNANEITTAPGHPITNVQDSRLSRNAWILPSSVSGKLYGISLYGVNPYFDQYALSDVIVDFDMKAVQDFDTFALAGNNFSIVNITLQWAVTDISTPTGSIVYHNASAQSAIVIPTGAQTARYLRVIIGNVLPTSNYEIVGRMSLGTSVDLPDMRPVIDLDLVSTANRTFSDTMQLYGGPKVVYRRLNISFPNIDDPSELIAIFRDVDLYNPFYLTWNESCAPATDNMYCTLAEDSLPINRNESGFYTSRLSFTEVF